MKKIYFLSAALSIAIVGLSQSGSSNNELAIEKDHLTKQKKSKISPLSKNVIYSNTFANPSEWVVAHDPNDCSLDWQIGAGLACTGSYPISTILSTTASDGYALLDSDSYGGATGGTEIEDSWLTMSNPVDLNGYPNVVVEFETQYRRYNSENPYLVVGIGDGNGNVVWPDLDPTTDISMMNNVFYPFPDWASQQGVTGNATANPEVIQVNISSALVGLTSTELADIYIRFNWTGTWGYAWFIDKVLTQLSHPCHYLLIGDGPERKAIQKAIQRNTELLAERNIHVHILGRKSDYWVHKAYTSADIFMMPNIKVEGDMEGFGIVLLEANLHFTPVFCSDLEGMKDVVEQGINGIKVRSEHQEQYVMELEKLLGNDTLLNMSLMGCTHVWENFQWDKVAEQYIQYIYKVSGV